MVSQEQILKIKFSTQSQYTNKIFDIIDKLLDMMVMDKEKRKGFVIAVGEALDNAIQHGNKLDKNKFVHIDCVVTTNKITCRIRDEGTGFDYKPVLAQPLTEFNPQVLMQRAALGKIGGLGIPLIRKCTDEVSFDGGGNEISISKYLQPACACLPVRARTQTGSHADR